MKKRNLLAGILVGVMAMTALAGCGETTQSPQSSTSTTSSSSDFKADSDITVVSRENGSGTRGAFIELFGIEQKDASGKKIDYTIDSADITNSTEVMLTSISGNKTAIGYISLGSLNKTVKALSIDNAAATVANIKNGSYKIARPFNIVTKSSGSSDTASDFIRYILSKDGQDVIEKNGYIGVADNPSYIVSGKKGKVTLNQIKSFGLKKLKEIYNAILK